MKNYAFELYSILGRRNESYGSNIVASRRPVDEGVGFWEEQRRAVLLLDRLVEFVDAQTESGQDMSVYTQPLATIHDYVFDSNSSWENLVSGPRFDSNVLALLHALALAVDVSIREPALTTESRDSIREGLNDFAAYLAESGESLSDNEKAYLLRLQQAIRDAVEDAEILGGLDLRARIAELMGFLAMLATKAKNEGKEPKRFMAMMSKLMPIFAISGKVGLAAIDAASNLKELSS